MAEGFEAKVNKVLKDLKINFTLKPLQKLCLEKLANRSDVFAVLPMGYGKSLLYTILPKLMFEDELSSRDTSIIIVISPLVSLMKDQVTNLQKYNVESVYLGGEHSEETLHHIKNGMFPVVLMSPESYFNGSWRGLLTSSPYQEYVQTIVIDECHCVEQWGEQFRTDYSRLGELRSIFPRANLLALTATATPSTRKHIAEVLCMKNYELVITSCDRPNIMHVSLRAPNTIQESFFWLCSTLQEQKCATEKCIIYNCRNIKSCGMLYLYLKETLGIENSYNGTPSARNCFYAMYHHSTSAKNKKVILETSPKTDSALRVVIATTAFGMGINVPDIRLVIHWGAPHTFQSYMQQSGRAGRDGLQSLSVVYYHPVDVSKIATDENCRTFCTTQSCRRKYMVRHFTPENITCVQDLHTCCDICKSSCACNACPEEHPSCLVVEEREMVRVLTESERRSFRYVTETQRLSIKRKLEELRRNVTKDLHISTSMLNVELLTGLSDNIVADIVSNVEYIFELEDIVCEYVYDETLAKAVLCVIEDVVGIEEK